MGGTMRLGARPTYITTMLPVSSETASLANEVYGFNNGITSNVILERHRHRYEVNPEKVREIERAGLYFSGRDDTNTRMEIAELSRERHPFYFGTQFHPEFKSRPNRPSPPFYSFCAMVSFNYQW